MTCVATSASVASNIKPNQWAKIMARNEESGLPKPLDTDDGKRMFLSVLSVLSALSIKTGSTTCNTIKY